MWKFLLTKVFKARDKFAVDLGGDKDAEKPFIEHLEDLRSMIVRMAITLVVVTIVTFVYCKELLTLIRMPIVLAGLDKKIVLINLQVTGGFMTAMNISLVAGIVLAFPLLLYFLLQFVLPGLRTTEKKILWPALAIGFGLFMTGMLFAFYVVSPRALQFFYEFSVDFLNNFGADTAAKAAEATKDAAAVAAPICQDCLRLRAQLEGAGLMVKDAAGLSSALTPGAVYPWEIVSYVKFICQFVLIFGACFELPVVVMAMVKLDVLNYQMMKGSRAWAAVIIAIVAAVITPTQDVFTLSLLAVPMYVLYEICIWLAYYMQKKDKEAYPEYYQQLEEDDKALKADEKADWDNEDYNPWSTADEKDDDDEAIRPKPKPVAPTSSEPAPTEPHPDAPAETTDAAPAKPPHEKTLEESSREDEQRTNTD